MLSPKTLRFIKDLTQNNNRDWFQENRKRYEAAKEDFTNLAERLILEVGQFEELGNTLPKDCVFRINRDIRFAKDKRPYKNNLSMAIGPGGRHSGRVDYYLQIQPGDQSFLGAGMWSPTANQLAKYRQEVDYNAAELKKIIENEEFRNFFPEIHGAALKTTPKGFLKDHPEIELLRRKELFFLHRFKDEVVQSETFIPEILHAIHLIKPYCDFLNYIFHDEKEEE
ncbi:DUF2461 domain-containing protein [Persicitalea jodogahamensis]|uniref:TIGR02453 family protein n=1 Tax=Persicitalea jodogahamensis TaxID=402147 RepID=A0A8J3DAB3_9BACT|nr:DUF2461 domain-containing protein [Persicitalea jodogahamensis]GHB81780.1 TIGR02453 family protein [Persicitalea jodogahamensis]